MKITPKTDEVINVLGQVVTVVNLIEYSITEIEKADSPTDEAKDIINTYQKNLDYCHSCKITAKDVYDEYWAICPSIESLPKCAKAIAVRFENVGIPVWVCDPYSDYQERVNNKIWSMNQQGIVTKSQASDLMCLFELLANWLMVWVFRVRAILKEMGVKPLPILTDKSEETGDEESDKPTALPDELKTDEAKSILQKAINAGLCDTNYQWKKSKALLAYFADCASEYLKLGKGEYDGKTKTSWKPFESLFGISGLSEAKRDYQKTGTLPSAHKDIDKLFE
ncbi:hypothetical protein [Bacteroides pyogenes]|uniref:hypothetical protein n=1 Tax=Bacteroides pyogenes TaxID=310300 RepID=UPI003FA04054